MSSIEESIQRMRVLNKEQEVEELHKQVASLEEQLTTVRELNELIRADVATAREAAQFYYDSFTLGISRDRYRERVVHEYAEKHYPFINTSPGREIPSTKD